MSKAASKSWEVVLNDGGLRSLIASAMSADSPWLALLFVHDGRINSKIRYDHFIRQAEQYGAAKRIELSMPHLRATSIARDDAGPNDVPSRPPLADMQLLTAAASEALQLNADRLIWPVQAGNDFKAIAHVTETVLMVQQLVRYEYDVDLEIETPLLELTDRQVIEVGHQMDVPWQISRSCLTRNWDACGRCAGCLWRQAAFTHAAIEDPAIETGSK